MLELERLREKIRKSCYFLESREAADENVLIEGVRQCQNVGEQQRQ